jgi:hypothetical protein
LLSRIDREVSDADKSELLRRQADALNPDTWVTPDDVRQALEHYERSYREIREALGRRRKRRRGTGSPDGAAADSDGGTSPSDPTEPAD